MENHSHFGKIFYKNFAAAFGGLPYPQDNKKDFLKKSFSTFID